VIEVAGDHLERVGFEDGQQLLVGQAQQLLEAVSAQNNLWSEGDGTPPR
jgi:hypothetical protein